MATPDREAVYRDMEATWGHVPAFARTIPDVALQAYWLMEKEFTGGETLIPNKYKDLIGIAVSGATRCRYCAMFHAEGARLNGATEAEIAEAAALAGHVMFGSTFLNAMQSDYDEFVSDVRQIVEYAKAHPPEARPDAAAHAK